MKKLKTWLADFNKRRTEAKYKRVQSFLKSIGMVPVRIVSKAGTDYILDAKGQFYRIGRAGRG